MSKFIRGFLGVILILSSIALIALSTTVVSFLDYKENQYVPIESKIISTDEITVYVNQKYTLTPYILNVSFIGIKAEVLLHLLEENNIYVATGSACTSKTSATQGSYVIKALGLRKSEIESAIRFSFSKSNTKEEVDKVIEVLKSSLTFLRRVRR